MRKKLRGILLLLVFYLGVLTPAAASTLGFTGNPAQDLWARQGNSLTLGTFIRGTGPMNFDVYAAAFYLDASSPLKVGNWQVGDLILGLGLVSQGPPDYQDYPDPYHDPRMVAKFGAATATFAPSSYVPSPFTPTPTFEVQGDGHGSFSGGNAGTGGVQVDYQYELTNGLWDNGQNLSGIIQTAANVLYYNGSASVKLPSADYGKVLGIFQKYTKDGQDYYLPQSFEVALDVSYLMRDNYSPSPDLHGKADLAWQMGSTYYTDAYVPDVGANAPLPGTLLLLSSGLLGLGLLRRKKSHRG